MASFFQKKPTPREAMRENKREMSSATRGVEREILGLQSEEKKLLAEIKRTAKTGNQAATRSLARELVRLRAQVTKLQGSRAQLRGVATHTQAMHANMAVAGAMKGAGKVMGTMNQQMDPAAAMRIAQEFQKQSAQMDMTQEYMGDAVDDALDTEGVDDESDELTNQILDEIGIDTAAQLTSAPKTKLAARTPAAPSAEISDDEDLERRLAALRSSS